MLKDATGTDRDTARLQVQLLSPISDADDTASAPGQSICCSCRKSLSCAERQKQASQALHLYSLATVSCFLCSYGYQMLEAQPSRESKGAKMKIDAPVDQFIMPPQTRHAPRSGGLSESNQCMSSAMQPDSWALLYVQQI